jgi:hypothetical protein
MQHICKSYDFEDIYGITRNAKEFASKKNYKKHGTNNKE